MPLTFVYGDLDYVSQRNKHIHCTGHSKATVHGDVSGEVRSIRCYDMTSDSLDDHVRLVNEDADTLAALARLDDFRREQNFALRH